MFRFRLEVAGDVQFDRAIVRFTEGIADYRPVWPVISADFYLQIGAQFASEGLAGGDKWEPLSEEYAKYKEAHWPGRPVLQRTGDLIDSLTNPSSPNTVRKEERMSLTLGSSLKYAIYHQKGTARMPAREEIVLTEPFKRTAMHHVQQYLVQIASQSGLRTGRTPGTPYKTDAGSGESWRRALAVGY